MVPTAGAFGHPDRFLAFGRGQGSSGYRHLLALLVFAHGYRT